jgi:nucleolar GTP-binding protein
MQSVSYNFKSIAAVPDSAGLIDIILSKTQRKTPTVTHPGYNIQRIRKFYMRKVRFTYNSVEEKLDGIIKGFPKLEDIHPFYADLINILYDKDHFKMALGYINTGKNLCLKVSKDYIKLMKYGDSLYRCKQLKVAALGRMATIMKKLNSSLKYLEEVRKHLGRLPSIDPFTRTLLLCGFPNVGKSSFMNRISNAESEVQPYPFTTQSLWAGHTQYKNIKWQVIDTPGILDRPLEERNTIEMQAITALAHLEAAVLYFIDISESCGYSLAEQLKLFLSIKPLFKNKPLVIFLNKIDLRPFEDLEPEEKKILENAAREHNTYLIKMSNVNNEGVLDVKQTSCDILLEYRRAITEKNLKAGNKSENYNNRIHIAQPIKRDNRKRNPFIPDSVVEEKKQIANEDKLMDKNPEDEFNRLLKEGEDEGLVKTIRRNRIKELMEQKGGDGVFFMPDREHFILEKPEWKDDVMPEIMDGKNIFDFVDPDIKLKVEQLQLEEDQRMAEVEMQDDPEQDSDLDDELLLEHDQMMENRDKIRMKHKSVKKHSVPRKARDLSMTEKFMTTVRTDLAEGTENMKLLSTKQRKEEKDKTKRYLLAHAKKIKEEYSSVDEDSDENAMDVDEEKPRRRTKLTPEEKKKREDEEKYRVETGRRMKAKINKKHYRTAKIDESDRRVHNMLPRHLNSGKRGIGKTDRR